LSGRKSQQSRDTSEKKSKQSGKAKIPVNNKALDTIRRKMNELAKELARSEEVGLDEETLMEFFEAKIEALAGKV
jgi:hypothetical protein